MYDLEAVKLLWKAAEFDRDSFEREAVRLVHRILCDLRKVPGQLPQRRVGRRKHVEPIG